MAELEHRETVVIGWSEDGKVKYLKSFAYDKQKDEAQAYLTFVQSECKAWKISNIKHLEFKDEETF